MKRLKNLILFLRNYTGLAFGFLILTLWIHSEVVKYNKKNKLIEFGIIGSGELIGFNRSISRGPDEYLFKYQYNDSTYYGKYYSGCTNISDLNSLRGVSFHTLIDTTDLENTQLLIFQKDFAEYNLYKKEYYYEHLHNCFSFW